LLLGFQCLRWQHVPRPPLRFCSKLRCMTTFLVSVMHTNTELRINAAMLRAAEGFVELRDDANATVGGSPSTAYLRSPRGRLGERLRTTQPRRSSLELGTLLWRSRPDGSNVAPSDPFADGGDSVATLSKTTRNIPEETGYFPGEFTNPIAHGLLCFSARKLASGPVECNG
jgi:hypothetical protein